MLAFCQPDVVGGKVVIEQQGKLLPVRNDTVIVNAGGVLPDDFLKSIGIAVDTKYGTA